MKITPLFLFLPALAIAQVPAPDIPESKPAPAADTERPVSWKKLLPNILDDEKKIWLFPLHLGQPNAFIPTAAVIGVTAGLVALDPSDAPYFRRTTTFNGFNKVFSSSHSSYGIIAAPVSFYLIGLVRKDSKMQKTALFAGEAVANAEILTTVFKDVDRRVRPAAIAPNGNFSDTFFDSPGSWLRGRGSFPSGHTIAAFSVATVTARRYSQHRWVPFVAYGLAGIVGFSRVSLSAHFVSDVFMGGALGYSISRFAVLRQ
jgi:membrane-associated phospholipid phosphatase